MCILFIKFLGNQFNHHSLRKPSPRLGMGTTRMPHFGQPPCKQQQPCTDTLMHSTLGCCLLFFSQEKSVTCAESHNLFHSIFTLLYYYLCLCVRMLTWLPGQAQVGSRWGCEPLGLGAEEEQWSSVRPPWFYSILGLYSYGFSEQLKHLTILKRPSIKLPYELEAEICKNSVH